jgi:3-dehydroquinate synthase
MKKILVKTPHPYSILIGEDLLRKTPRFLSRFLVKSAVIIADRRLKNPRRVLLGSFKKAGWNVSEIPVTAGEGLKDFKVIYPIYGELIKRGVRRDSLIIALGGGSIGDAAGFIAATYLRGVPWVGVPTTLLAQVDSSVGGKTGINHALGKNLIGAFHQPSLVVCDVNLLATLSHRERVSGLGEALKYGLIYDAPFFNFFKNNWSQALALYPKTLESIVFKSLKYKASAVTKDEKDLKGIREFLNFGHTFAHGIESVSKYKKFQHGEAVIWGMRIASTLSFLKSKITKTQFQEIDEFLKTISLPSLKGLSYQKIFNVMQTDKKMKDGKINFVLLSKIGSVVSENAITLKDLKHAWDMIGDDY